MEVEGPTRPRRPLEVGDTSSPITWKRIRFRPPTIPTLMSLEDSEEKSGEEHDQRHGQDQEENADNNGEEGQQQQSESGHESSDQCDSEEDMQHGQQGSAPESSSGSSESLVIEDVTLENAGVLDCGVCFLPLKPPIFQCAVGHVVCSACRAKLAVVGRCYICCAPTPNSYRRCHAMEKLVDSICMPCPHFPHGCKTKPAYHNREDHARSCVHAPCRCPGEACAFVGSTATLLDHFATTHGWPCTAETLTGSEFDVDLRDGLNIVTPVRAAAEHLFVLNLTQAPFGCAVTAFCVHPHPDAIAKLMFSYSRLKSGSCLWHNQWSVSESACTDLSSALPADSKECFQLVLPRTVHEEGEGTIRVKVLIGTISPSSARSSTFTFGLRSSVATVLLALFSLRSSQFRLYTVDQDIYVRACFDNSFKQNVQCDVGHVLCSACHAKLDTAGRCYVCRVQTPGGYRRCVAMEQLVDSIRVPCPHAAHGCKTKPAYHDREDHARACTHAPCRCPGEACAFVGSTATLLDHFAAVHGWPCTAETSAGSMFDVDLRDGLNIVTPVHATAEHLFVLNLTGAPFGCVITAFCVHPDPAATAELKLSYSHVKTDSWHYHYQCSMFQLACTDLSSALPADFKECFQLVFPRTVDGEDEGTSRVRALIGATSPSSARPSTSILG
ncbi:hypothetical protein EJB05_33784, partial [Eragrostis curvula]